MNSISNRHLIALGRQLRMARQRRAMTMADLGARAGLTRQTVAQLESGSDTVGLGALVRVLDVLGLAQTLEQVAHPQADAMGQALANEALPQRVRTADQTDRLRF